MNDIRFVLGLGASMAALYYVAVIVDMLDISGRIEQAARRVKVRWVLARREETHS